MTNDNMEKLIVDYSAEVVARTCYELTGQNVMSRAQANCLAVKALISAIEELEIDAALGRSVRLMEQEVNAKDPSIHTYLDLRVYNKFGEHGGGWYSGIGSGWANTPEEALEQRRNNVKTGE